MTFNRPFDKPFDRLTVLSKVEGLTALRKAERPRCVSSLVTAAYCSVSLIPEDSRALYLDFFLCLLIYEFLRYHQHWLMNTQNWRG